MQRFRRERNSGGFASAAVFVDEGLGVSAKFIRAQELSGAQEEALDRVTRPTHSKVCQGGVELGTFQSGAIRFRVQPTFHPGDSLQCSKDLPSGGVLIIENS